jgi:predicted component of type VI protein secretion system
LDKNWQPAVEEQHDLVALKMNRRPTPGDVDPAAVGYRPSSATAITLLTNRIPTSTTSATSTTSTTTAATITTTTVTIKISVKVSKTAPQKDLQPRPVVFHDRYEPRILVRRAGIR